MADPRNAVDFGGIGYQAETFLIDNSTITYSATEQYGSAQVGLAVTLSAASTVALAADAQAVIGKLVKVESDNKAVVQTGGYCELPAGTAAGLTLGGSIVGDLLVAAPGYIRVAIAAEAPAAKHTIINATTTTAVVVKLQ